jgi:hypothetical protein
MDVLHVIKRRPSIWGKNQARDEVENFGYYATRNFDIQIYSMAWLIRVISLLTHTWKVSVSNPS